MKTKTKHITHHRRILFGSLFALLILVFSTGATTVLAAPIHGIPPPHGVVHATKGHSMGPLNIPPTHTPGNRAGHPVKPSSGAYAPWTPDWNYTNGFHDTHDYSDGTTDEYGIDVFLPLGTAIYAPESGTIIAYQPCPHSWCPGRIVEQITSGPDNGAVVAFGHVNQVAGLGPVVAGQEIATVGWDPDPNCDPPNSGCSLVEFMYSKTGAWAYQLDFLPPPPVSPSNGCPRNFWNTSGGTSADPCTVLTAYMHGNGPNKPPIGNVDGVDGNTALGWAFDPDVSSQSIDTQMSIDGNSYDMGTTPYLRQDVNNAFGITGNHGFAWPIPPQWGDGYQHSWQIYGVDPDNGNSLTLIGSGSFQRFAGYQMALQANTGLLWTTGTLGTYNLNMGMMKGTSPSIAALANGGYQMALQANTGLLWTTGSLGTYNLNMGMKKGTSPSIVALPSGGYQIALQANTGLLWTTGSLGTYNWNVGMMKGTSPSIAALTTGGFEVAFQDTKGTLQGVGSLGTYNWNMGMMKGTSPSIAGMTTGGFEVAFQANTGLLWSTGSLGLTNWNMGMMKGTSPSIAGMTTGGFEAAFQANTGLLWSTGSLGTTGWNMGMMKGTSPSIAGLAAGGFQMALQANTGLLWTTGTRGTTGWNMGMLAGTSPSIT